MNYYIRRGNQEFGPYTEADLRNYVASGNIHPSELARAEGSAQLVAVSSLLGMPAGRRPCRRRRPQRNTRSRAMPRFTLRSAQEPRCIHPVGHLPWTLGIHNFYAGYNGKGIAQLLITVLTFGLGGLVTWIWAIVDVCTVTVDAGGVPFE